MHSPFSLFLKPLKSLIAYEEILRLFRVKSNLQFPYRQSPPSDYGLSIAHGNPEFYIINGAISLQKVYSGAFSFENCIYLSTICCFHPLGTPPAAPAGVDSGIKRQELSRSVSFLPGFSWSGFFLLGPLRFSAVHKYFSLRKSPL